MDEKMINIREFVLSNKQTIKNAFEGSTALDESMGNSVNDPFRCITLYEFLKSESQPTMEFFVQLRKELEGLEMFEKNNDLYRFHQSEDLKLCKGEAISAIRKLFNEEVRQLMIDVTGISLNETVNLTYSVYQQGDVLLCHDDELDTRRIAFVLYISPEWSVEDGGALNLFNTDTNGCPNKIVHSLVPRENAFLFFEVAPNSYHEVAEILSKDRKRLSINGWFHADELIIRPPPYVEPPIALESPGDIDSVEFFSWINPMYLDPETQLQIQEAFEDSSELSLDNFFSIDKYTELCEAMNLESNWQLKGPANKRRYFTYVGENDIVTKCLAIMKSEAMFLVLSQLTGLKLHPLAEGDESDAESGPSNSKKAKVEKSNGDGPSNSNGAKVQESNEVGNGSEKNQGTANCIAEFRKFDLGCYTLLHDTDSQVTAADYCLDVEIFFNLHQWSPEFGGSTNYIVRGEDESLLEINPKPNCLALIYRDPDSIRFMKYLNHIDAENNQKRKGFQDLNATYYEAKTKTSESDD